LDARSDVYSLGVIVYRMLAGRAPFGGSVTELVVKHQQTPPPPLTRREAPPQVAAVIMAALAKDPAQRPANVEAFAKSLRANAEGLFVLARRAAAIYLEHLPLFLKLTVAVFFVPILIRAAWAICEALPVTAEADKPLRAGLTALFGLAASAADFLAVTVLCGLTAVAVLLLRVTPQRRLKAETVLKLMRQRWRLVLDAAWGLLWRMVAGFLLCGIPTLILYWRSMLFAPVVMVEGKAYKEAIARGRALNKRAIGTVVAVMLFQVIVSDVILKLGQEYYQPGQEPDAHGPVVKAPRPRQLRPRRRRFTHGCGKRHPLAAACWRRARRSSGCTCWSSCRCWRSSRRCSTSSCASLVAKPKKARQRRWRADCSRWRNGRRAEWGIPCWAALAERVKAALIISGAKHVARVGQSGRLFTDVAVARS
jgi:hypothetical protein